MTDLTVLSVEEIDNVTSLLKIGNFVNICNIFHFIDNPIYSNLWSYLRLNIMFNFIVFALQILKHSRLLNYIIRKLFPFHISIPININFIEEISQIAHQSILSIGEINLPKFKMFPCNCNKL